MRKGRICEVEGWPSFDNEYYVFSSRDRSYDYIPAEHLSAYYPLILQRHLDKPEQTARRVIGRLLKIIFSEMVQAELGEDLSKKLVESGLIIEDRHNPGRVTTLLFNNSL